MQEPAQSATRGSFNDNNSNNTSWCALWEKEIISSRVLCLLWTFDACSMGWLSAIYMSTLSLWLPTLCYFSAKTFPRPTSR